MQGTILQIYGTFILTLAGFVLPLIAIALSAFPEGVKALRQTYENEQKQSEKNLAEELKKLENRGVDSLLGFIPRQLAAGMLPLSHEHIPA